MNELVQAVKATGSIELLSFVPKILSQRRTAKKDTWILTWSILDERAANCHGQANIKAYNRQPLISVGAKPSSRMNFH
jgi:hypothetical protein